jgi:hypothetical protein
MTDDTPPARNPYFISFEEWSHIQNTKKARSISAIENLLIIQSSKEHEVFNTAIKKLVRMNIFDLSRISYLAILFLSPYLDPHLKEVLNYDEDVSTSIINRIYKIDGHDYLPPLDKTISHIINIIINQIITMELFLNIHVFILYLNLTNHFKPDINTPDINTTIGIGHENLIVFKIASLINTITSKITKSTLSLLIMKTINRLGRLNSSSILSKEQFANLEDEMVPKMQEILNNTRTNHELLDNFIITILKMCDCQQSIDVIWNTCKNHLVSVMQNGIQLFKMSLDLLISLLAKEQPELQSKGSNISNSIMNFLEAELDLLDTKLTL